MPIDYFAPGVYVEEVDRGSRPIDGVTMSVAGFVGFTEDVRGGAELFKPMLITSWNQYLEYFSKQGSDGFTDFDAYLPFSVYGWFLNGGGRCWVTSIGTQLPGMKSEDAVAKTTISTAGQRPSLLFKQKASLPPSTSGRRALTAGRDSATGSSSSSLMTIDSGFDDESVDDRIKIQIMPSTPKEPEDFDGLSSSQLPVDTGEFFSVTVVQGEEVLEEYEHLSMNPNVATEAGDYVLTALRDSPFLEVEDLLKTGQPLAKRPANGVYEITPPPIAPEVAQFNRSLEGARDDRSGIQGLFEVDEVSMVACPDLMRAYQAGLLDQDQLHSAMDMMVSLCEAGFPNVSHRMAVLDTPPDKQKPQHLVRWLDDFGRRSQFAALYYPWIKVANPRKGGKPIAIPPSGHMMGVWCRTDETRGIHKAPANEVPKGVLGLAYDVNFREQELLNPLGINCVRKFPNRGIRIWGARTLVEPDNVQWRYISVRRLISYIERCIEIGTQWAVFEPNDEDLWARVTRTISNFLDRLWREGALYGSNPKEAFYVKCDRTLNTPETVMLGRLYIEVGVSPVRPAEFIIIRLSQTVGSESGQ
jgi:hypothetical protein